MFSGGAIDDASSRTSLWILGLVGIGVAAVLTAVGYGFCMQVPRDNRSRATALGCLLLAVMGYCVFLGGCIWSYMEFEDVRAMLGGSGSKTAPPSFGMVAGILGYLMLLSQPLVFMFFLRTASITGRAEYFASSISYGIAFTVLGVVAYIVSVVGLFWALRDMLESIAGSQAGGGVEIVGMVGGISAIVAFFTALVFSIWYIVELLYTRVVICRHVERIR
jgi:hypothetical protein